MNNTASIMQKNLDKVWNERNADQRIETIREIYSPNATLNHVGDQVTGHQAINDAVTATLQHLPPNFVFTTLKPIIINNSIGRLIWGAGEKGQSPQGTGMDIAHFENDQIKSLYVFLES